MLDNLLDKRSEKRETGRDKHFVATHGGSEFAKICQRTDPNITKLIHMNEFYVKCTKKARSLS